MQYVLIVVVYGLTARHQYSRSLRWGNYPQRAILDAIVAAVFLPFSWIIWFFRRPYHK